MKYKEATQHSGAPVAIGNDPQLDKIRQEGLRLLSRREHSRKEMQGKLSLKGYDRDQVAEVISQLGQQQWQDDSRYAESYVRVRSQKGFGPARIAYELQQQGIAQATVENSLQMNWMVLLAKVYAKKYPGQKAIDSAEKAKRIRFLLQRGFSSAMINTLFKDTISKSS